MNIVIIPTFRRPEYLFETLHNIKKADEYNEQLYLFCADYGHDKKCLDIIREAGLSNVVIKRTECTPYLHGKQSYSVLQGMKTAAEYADNFFLIEDDIFIGKDFFTFCSEAMQRQPDVFATIMSQSNNHPVITTPDNNAYYLSDKADYQGYGVCYNAALFNKYVLPHITDRYFSNPSQYITKNFTTKVCQASHTEQDGLIRRIIENNKLLLLYPHVPRAYHAGVWGYHRRLNKGMNYAQKLAFIREVCYDVKKINKYNPYNDLKPCDLNTSHKKNELYLKKI